MLDIQEPASISGISSEAMHSEIISFGDPVPGKYMLQHVHAIFFFATTVLLFFPGPSYPLGMKDEASMSCTMTDSLNLVFHDISNPVSGMFEFKTIINNAK